MALTQEQASQRFSLLEEGSISYQFHLAFEKGENYLGMSTITFSVKELGEQLFLDGSSTDIRALMVNGVQISPEKIQEMRKQDKFLYLSKAGLVVGKNIVNVVYKNKYLGDGLGLSSFGDTDSKQYVYSVFEPYLANRAFFLFDQPDLKARMELFVLCPDQWRIQSNELHIKQQPINQKGYLEDFHCESDKIMIEKYLKLANKDEKTKLFVFPPTEILPTYLYAVIAGPYASLSIENSYKNIPMRLFCLHSYLPFLQKWREQITEITYECLAFYQDFFGVPYPFKKLDQVFVHEFDLRGMENAGLIIYSDTYISNPDISEEDFLDFAATITHEIAHQWFGNLATMKWWDDLWLNQSFAIYISYFVLHKIQHKLKTFKFDSSMAQYFGYKTWAYGEDQAIETHPVKGKVPNTSVAESIFDGITYCKGGSVIKQLIFLVGEENFSKALANHFKKFSFKNATLQDLLASIEEFCIIPNFDIKDWKEKWLLTSSLNTLQPRWGQKVEGGRILQIHQGFHTPQYPIYRLNKIKIALFKQDCSFDVTEAVVLAQEVTKIGIQFPQGIEYSAVLLNYEDHAYAKIRIDKQSQSFFSKNLTKLNDLLTRTLIWYSFYELVADGQIPSTDFIDLFIANIEGQRSDGNVQIGLDKVFKCITSFTPIKYRQQLFTRIFYFVLQWLQETLQSQQNRVLILKSNLIKFANSDISINILLQWLQNRYQPLKGHAVSPKMKWEIIQVVCTSKSLSLEKKKNLIYENSIGDESENTINNAKICECLLADEDKFKQLYEQMKKGDKSFAQKREISKGWNHFHHHEKLLGYKQAYFSDIKEIVYSLTRDHAVGFIQNLQPLDDDLEENLKVYSEIQIEGEQHERVRVVIRGIINEIKGRINAYIQHWR